MTEHVHVGPLSRADLRYIRLCIAAHVPDEERDPDPERIADIILMFDSAYEHSK